MSLKSRSIEAGRAVALSLEAEAWLRAHGAGHVLFKICSTFDSTDAGNIGPVTDALRARAGCGAVLVNPAFPETGRSVFQGHLFVNGVPLHESPLRDHPLNPMRDSDLVRVLGRQSAAPVALVPFAVVEQGVAAVRAALAETGAGRRDRRRGGGAPSRRAGRGGIGGPGVGRCVRPRRRAGAGPGEGGRRCRARARRRRTRPAVSPRSWQAVARPRPGGRSMRRSPRACPACGLTWRACWRAVPPPVVAGALEWARPLLAQGPVLVASSDAPDAVSAMQASHGGAAAGHAVEQALADIAEALVAQGVRRLVVAGGESSGAVVDRLGLQAFLIGREIAPGVPVLHTEGARHAGLAVALKSGNFGQDDFFLRALSMMG